MIQALQLILALSFLVIIHEFGHFAFARLFGVRVEKFYMFFNPKISLVRCKYFEGRWHFAFLSPNTDEDHEWSKHPETTEWGLGWLPFGGYCAICGMVDETHDSESLGSEMKDYEFRAKPAWQRLLIILGGILVNFVAAMVIFTVLIAHNGTTTMPLRNMQQGLYYSDIFIGDGFQQQDKILTINGKEPEVLTDVVQSIIIEGKRDVVVLRGEDTLSLTMSADLGQRYLATQQAFDRRERDHARQDPTYSKLRYVPVAPYFPFVVDTVFPGTAAAMAGLRRGDSIVAVGDKLTPSYNEVVCALQLHPMDSIGIRFYRNGVLCEHMAFLGDQCRLGTFAYPVSRYVESETRDYAWYEAIPAGWNYGCEYLGMYIKQFRLVFSKEGAQSMGGFGAIGQMFPKLWDWSLFWHMTAVLSLILAFMNFLPIPALDGGYILFLLYEMITRRKPSDKFLEKANEVGFWLLLALMIFANANDLLKLFF